MAPISTSELGQVPDPLPSKILIVRLGAIGDVVNALVVANAIKEAAPEIEIGWAVHPLSAPLVEGHPSIDRVHVWPRGGGLRGFLRLRREVRAVRYGAALDLQRLQKSSLLARMSGAPRVIGFDRARSKEGSWLWTKETIAAGPKREHMVRQYMRFPVQLGLSDQSPRRDLPRVQTSAERMRELIPTQPAPILLNLGASKPNKKWPTGHFRAALERLLEESPDRRPVVLTGGPGDKDAAACIAEGLNVTNLVGKTSLKDLWEICRMACCMVTADTGPMHICAAVGTPVVAIFGPGDPARTGPYGTSHIVLQDDAAIPRANVVSHAEPLRLSAMESTSVSEVISAVGRMLHSP